MNTETSFGQWIRHRRKGVDLTQQELAQRVGCSLSLVIKIEADERRPSRQVAESLAKHLEIPSEQRELFLKIARQEKGTASLESITPFSAPQTAFTDRRSWHNRLPISPTTLVGRENEIDTLVSQLLAPTCRLLTLTGPGGVGKTRLAIEVAHRLEASFADGVFFLSMAGISLPESIVPTIADIFGMAFSGPADPKLQLVNFLRTKEILLVFDNFEHLLAGGSLLSELLQQVPKLKLLVTSREQLHLHQEWVFEVQSLPVPEVSSTGAAHNRGAVALFRERARQVSHSFSVEEDNSACVRICQLVDGLPLAIELAASWVKVLSCREIAHELERGLHLLETTMHDLPQRHRSIRNVFDHSWKLLADDERNVLMRLSVFQGGFTRDVANVVASASLLLLSSLVGKSLLRHNKSIDRYEMHELTRQYARARLQEQPALETQTLEEHAKYYAQWLLNNEARLKSDQQLQTSALIRAETPNWQSAWLWAVTNMRLDFLRQMIPCLYWYYEVHGYYAEALSSYGSAVNELGRAGDPSSLFTPEARSTFAFLVDQLGWFEFRMGNVTQGANLFAESLSLAREGRDQEVLYHIHGNWGYLALLSGDIAEAKRLTTESLMNARALNSPWHIAIPTNVLGIVDFQEGNLQTSYQQLVDSLKMWRAVGDPRGLVFCMLYLGAVALALRNPQMARSVLKESYTIAKNKMDRWAQAFSLDLLGQVAMSERQPEESGHLFQEALTLFQEIGDQWGATQSLIHLGDSRAALQQTEEAKRLLREAYRNASQAGWIPTISEVLIAFVTLDHQISSDTKLGVSSAVLQSPTTAPHVRARAEDLRAQLLSALTSRQIKTAKMAVGDKSPEAWAQEILK